MNPLRRILGPSPIETWQQLCLEHGGQFIDRGFEYSGNNGFDLLADPLIRRNFEARIPHRHWLILHQYWPGRGDGPVFYGINAPFISLDGLRFDVDRHRLINLGAKLFGLPSVKTGIPDFDDRFALKSNDAETLRRLFSHAPLRELLTAQTDIHLEIDICPQNLRKTVPAATHVLNCSSGDITGGIEQKRRLLTIVTTTLDQLAAIGSAFAPNPE